MAWINTYPKTSNHHASKRQRTQPLVCISNRPSPPPSLPLPLAPSRRCFLFTAACMSTYLAFRAKHPVHAFTDVQRFTFTPLDATIEYPRSWFRSQKKGTLVVVNLKDVVAATVSRKRIKLRQDSDPYSTAFELVRDRIEEGSDIALKRARFEEDGALVFNFVGETLKPNGDVVVRYGVGKCLNGKNEGEGIVCIVTAPKEKWEQVKGDAEAIVMSFRVG